MELTYYSEHLGHSITIKEIEGRICEHKEATDKPTSPLVQTYLDQLKDYGQLTWDQIDNYIVFGDIRGKLTGIGRRTTRELGMESTQVDELILVKAVMDAHNSAL